MNIQNN